MIEEQLAKMLDFRSIEEMNLFHDVCIGYQVNKVPSKQECNFKTLEHSTNLGK